MQIDGNENSVYEVNVVAEEPGEHNPRENAFYAKSTLLATELEARRNICLETARYWKIVNDNVKNEYGQSVGYKMVTGENCFPFASENSSLMKRAGFIKQHLWVTPYHEDEIYASGNYPNQHAGGDGLNFGRVRTGRSAIKISSYGTRWGIRMCPGPRIGRLCRQPTSASH